MGFITVSCRRPFDIAFSGYFRPNLYSRHRCRRAVHCSYRRFHRLRHRVLLVSALQSQARLRASYATLFDGSGTKPDDERKIIEN